MSRRIDDLPMWRVGASFATVALVSLLFRIYGLALICALVGGGLLVGAWVTSRRTRQADRT